MATVSVVMPAYNEANGIPEFLAEIAAAFEGIDTTIFVVDDQSSDDTAQVVEEWSAAHDGLVTLIRSTPNAGHGPTTVKALRAGLSANPQVVVAVDGDGQFYGADLRRVADLALTGTVDIVEGVRTHRGDPLFRQIASFATRTLVQARAGVRPTDANTPLRGYRPEILASLLDLVPADAYTPNLIISAAGRKRGYRVIELAVESLDRRGGEAAGSTWGQRRRSLPTKRFLTFCVNATKQWFSTGR